MKLTRLVSYSSVALLGACLFMVSIVQATPITGPHYKPKWSQGPDMDTGTDTLSMHRSFGPVVADDFQSDGRVIAGFHWWGSYFQNAGQGLERDVVFEISLHTDCPASDPSCNNGGPYPYSTPSNDPNYFSAIVTVEEDYFGTTSLGEDVYEYWIKTEGLTGPDFWNGTWNEVAGEIYWLDVAWAAGQFGTSVSDDVWGWHDSSEQYLDNAVQTTAGGGANPHIGPWDMLGGDKAFEVWTVPEPSMLALLIIGFAGAKLGSKRKVTRNPGSLAVT